MSGRLARPERLRAWTHYRQRLGRAAVGPAEALGDVVAVYSSHPTAPLALLARSRTLDPAAFAALEQRRSAVRIPGLRGSIFLVPTATAPRIFAATRLPPVQHARRLHYAGLDPDEYERLKPRVLEQAREPVTTAALQAAIRLDARLMTAVRVMALEGLVLRLGSSLRSDSLRYVATEAWLGQPLEAVDPEASLRWLAEAYLHGYGPARVADFAWWAGVPKRRAAAALAGIALADVGGGLLLPPEQRDAFEAVEPLEADAVDVLPKWDAYTMGYAPDGRQRLLDDAHLPRAYSTARQGTGATSGDGLPLLLHGGRAVATWSHRFEGDRMRVTVAPFEAGALAGADGEGVLGGVGALLGASAVEVEAAAQ